MKAMLLAAGEGTRFRPHTSKVPKPALPLLNVPLGFYSFDFLKNAGVTSLVVNTYHLPEQIKSIYTTQSFFPVTITEEKDHILGSGGGLGYAKAHFDGEEDFFHLNADEVIITRNEKLFDDLKKVHLKEKPICTLMVTNHPEVGTKFGGVWVDVKGQVIGFGKVRPTEAVHGFHYLGVQILNRKIFDFIPDGVESNILYDAVMGAINQGHRVQVHNVECGWAETGNLHDYMEATKNILRNLADQNPEYQLLKDFLKKVDPQSQLIKRDGALVWAHAQADLSRVQIKNFAVIGRGSKLSDCEIEASVIAEAQEISNQKILNQFIL